MIGLDTDVLVRYLTQDDRAQARKAEAVIDGAVARRERCVVRPADYVIGASNRAAGCNETVMRLVRTR